MECSVCQSTNLVKVSLAYEQGLSEYKGRSRSHGLSLGTGGLGLWGGRAKTTGTFQTRLSARLSPPTKRSYWKTFKWWLAGLFILWFVGIAVAGKCSQCEGIQPGIRLGHGCLCRALWSFCGALFGDTTTACFRFSTDAGTVPSCADAAETSKRISKEQCYEQSGDQPGAGKRPVRCPTA